MSYQARKDGGGEGINRILPTDKSKSEKAIYVIITTIRCSEKGKTIETVRSVVARNSRVANK